MRVNDKQVIGSCNAEENNLVYYIYQESDAHAEKIIYIIAKHTGSRNNQDEIK